MDTIIRWVLVLLLCTPILILLILILRKICKEYFIAKKKEQELKVK